MKKIIMFDMAYCPYCRAAHRYMDELRRENPAYAALEITGIDEGLHPDIANRYDYYYVPTFYVDGVKLHEGAAKKEDVERVFKAAL